MAKHKDPTVALYEPLPSKGAYTSASFPGSKKMSAKNAIMRKGKATGFAGHGKLDAAHGTTAGKQKDHPFNKNPFGGCKPHNNLSKTPGGVKK